MLINFRCWQGPLLNLLYAQVWFNLKRMIMYWPWKIYKPTVCYSSEILQVQTIFFPKGMNPLSCTSFSPKCPLHMSEIQFHSVSHISISPAPQTGLRFWFGLNCCWHSFIIIWEIRLVYYDEHELMRPAHRRGKSSSKA